VTQGKRPGTVGELIDILRGANLPVRNRGRGIRQLQTGDPEKKPITILGDDVDAVNEHLLDSITELTGRKLW